MARGLASSHTINRSELWISNLCSSKGRKYQSRSMNIAERHCPRQGVVGSEHVGTLMLTRVNTCRDSWHVQAPMEIPTQTLTLALFAGIKAALSCGKVS